VWWEGDDLVLGEAVFCFVGGGDDLAFDRLDRNGAGGGVFCHVRVGFHDEQGDGSFVVLVECLLSLAVARGGWLGSECSGFFVQVEDQVWGVKSFGGCFACAFVGHGGVLSICALDQPTLVDAKRVDVRRYASLLALGRLKRATYPCWRTRNLGCAL